MKFIHLADLHIGRRIKEYSLIEDQKYILDKIIGIIESEKPDVVIIAGDVYDRQIPSGEAVTLLDDFLYKIIEHNVKVLLVSGNHDSPERVAFGNRFMDKSGLYISPVYNGMIKPIDVKGVNIWLMPFIRPYNVRQQFPDETIENYTDAMRVAVDKLNIDTDKINIMVAHQNCIMESIGTMDYVDPEIFSVFDYTALGHIHKPMDVGENVRYCGSPLKYSLPTTEYDCHVPVVEINGKNDISTKFITLEPLHKVCRLTGDFNNLISSETNYDFVYIELTNTESVSYAADRLREVYPNLMDMNYINKTDTKTYEQMSVKDIKNISDEELFCLFFKRMNDGEEVTEEQLAVVRDVFKEIGV